MRGHEGKITPSLPYPFDTAVCNSETEDERVFGSQLFSRLTLNVHMAKARMAQIYLLQFFFPLLSIWFQTHAL